jgi:hypothetical protein
MMSLGLPHLNVLTKCDLVNEDDLEFPLDFYSSRPNFALLAKAHAMGGAGKKGRRKGEFFYFLVLFDFVLLTPTYLANVTVQTYIQIAPEIEHEAFYSPFLTFYSLEFTLKCMVWEGRTK